MSENTEKHSAMRGNKFWTARSKHGRGLIFESPEKLWDACCEYFEWCDSNPILEAKAFAFQGNSWIEDVPKMRMFTLIGMCRFLEIDDQTWKNYCKRDEFKKICETIENCIKEQKLTGAAAGMLNPIIVCRDLGLADKQELSHKVTDDGTNEW